MLPSRSKPKLDWATECQTPLDETRISIFKMNNNNNSTNNNNNNNANTSSNPNNSSSSSSSSQSSSSSTLTNDSSTSTVTATATATTTATATNPNTDKDSPEQDHHHQPHPFSHPRLPSNMYYPSSTEPALASMGVDAGSTAAMGAHHHHHHHQNSNTHPHSSRDNFQSSQLVQTFPQQQQQQQQQIQQQQPSFIQNSPLPPGASLLYPPQFFNNMNMSMNPDVYAATVAMQQRLGLAVSGMAVGGHGHGHTHAHAPQHQMNMSGPPSRSQLPSQQHNPSYPNPALSSMGVGISGMGALPGMAGLSNISALNNLSAINTLGVGANPNLVPGIAALGLSPSPHHHPHHVNLNLNHLNLSMNNPHSHPQLHHPPPPHGGGVVPPISPSSPSVVSAGVSGGLPGGPSANNRKLGLYKTELCRSWEEKGTCRYGPKCQFAHGEDEIRRVARHPKYKTEICRTFWVSGSCPYGKRCCFIHTELPAGSPPADGAPATASSTSTSTNPTPGVPGTSGPASPVKNKSFSEAGESNINGPSETISLLTRSRNGANMSTPNSVAMSAPVTASSTPPAASPAPGSQNTSANSHNLSSSHLTLSTPTTEGSVTPTSAYSNNTFPMDSVNSTSATSTTPTTGTPTGRSSRPTFLRVDTRINTAVSMKQNKSAFPIMNPNTLTSLSLGGMGLGLGGSGSNVGVGNATGLGNASSGSRLSFGRVSTSGAGINGASSGSAGGTNIGGGGAGQSQIGYGGALLSPAPVTAGPEVGGTARRFENFDRYSKVSTPITTQPTPLNSTPPRAPSASESNRDISPPTTSAGATSSTSSSSGSGANPNNISRHSFNGTDGMTLPTQFAGLSLNTNVNGVSSTVGGPSTSIPYGHGHGLSQHGRLKNTPPPLTAGPVPSASTAAAQAILHGRSGSDGSGPVVSSVVGGVGMNLNGGGLSGLNGMSLGGLNMAMMNGGGNGGTWGGNANNFMARGALSALPGGPSVVPPWASNNPPTGGSGKNNGNGTSSK